MNHLSAMYELCQSSSTYIRMDTKDHAALCARAEEVSPAHFLELEDLINAYGDAATLEGFVNGYIWAQSTEKECLNLRERPKGLYIKMDPDLLSAAVEAMRELQERYEAEAAAFASLGDAGQELAEERIESAGVAQGLFNFFVDL